MGFTGVLPAVRVLAVACAVGHVGPHQPGRHVWVPRGLSPVGASREAVRGTSLPPFLLKRMAALPTPSLMLRVSSPRACGRHGCKHMDNSSGE